MKKLKCFAAAFAALILSGICTSCSDLFGDGPSSSGKASISFVFADNWDARAREAAAMPDTNDFLLTVSSSSGEVLFNGKFGSAPETIIAAPGTYTVNAVSAEFSEPKFEAPQYGDTQVVTVLKGENALVRLSCSQINCGVKLNIQENFRMEYPDASLYLKSNDGRLMYSYSEKRTAYFRPGTISLLFSDGGAEKTLFTRALQARQVLVLTVSAAESATKGGVQIQVDTLREWLSEQIKIGEPSSAEDREHAYSVSDMEAHVGEEDVWVYGYIVGGDLSSTKCSFTAPFTSRTNLVLAARSSVTDRSKCVSVQLAKGDIRDALNLVDHPENLGRQVYLKGDIVASYYGLTGLQNLSEYADK
ncbi:MAG: DUF4493 domain-containing protein [Bacteroidales bacterium]|nr:DUF4493 domain-containing protein [Bacteroidales bacterium]